MVVSTGVGPDGAVARPPALKFGGDGPIPLYWWNGRGGRNFGDAISRYIVRALTGRHVVHAAVGPRLVAVGSVLRVATPGDVVWGSGLSRPSDVARDLQIHALRGPATHELVSQQGYPDAPRIYGDPALLLPRIVDASDVAVRHAVGIVPHYVDAGRGPIQTLRAAGTHIIDVLRPPLEVAREIVSCELIYSSSLHGLIVAEAFGVPAIWVELGDDIIGGGFKFRDYYLASGRPPPAALDWRAKAELSPQHQPLEIATPDLDALLRAFPLRRQRGPLRRVRL